MHPAFSERSSDDNKIDIFNSDPEQPASGQNEMEKVMPETEQLLYDIFRSVLGVEEFGGTDSPQVIGLTSLEAIKICDRR